MRWIILTMMCISTLNANALSFLDKEHTKKLSKEAKKQKRVSVMDGPASPAAKSPFERDAGLTPLQLFTSPLQPSGGSLMCSLNWPNILRLVAPNLAAKMDKGRSQIDRYVDNLVETDDDVVALRNDPALDDLWKFRLKCLKAEKRIQYFQHVVRMELNGH